MYRSGWQMASSFRMTDSPSPVTLYGVVVEHLVDPVLVGIVAPAEVLQDVDDPVVLGGVGIA